MAFFLNLHVAIPTYINSTFLENFIPKEFVGIIYTIGALLAIFAFIILPNLLEKYGNYRVGITALFVEFIAILGLSITKDPIFILVSFIISLVLIRVVSFNADIFLESLSSDSKTGGIRGFFLSTSSAAWVAAPVLGGFLLGNGNFSRLYLVSALVSLPVFFFLITKFKNFRDPNYDRMSFWKTLRLIWIKNDIRKIVLINTLLRFFYSWMVIYTPIYLKEVMGFSWSEIGLIFSIMLTPFVFLQAPLGKIADKYLGEKELLSAGIFILVLATAVLSFIKIPSFILWALVLFLTRVGASSSEVMSETYFFKKIDGTDSNLVGFFRMTGPIAYVISPLVATFILGFAGLHYLFLILGIIMLFGLWFSFSLKDTL